jgi:hypothetical protein
MWVKKPVGLSPERIGCRNNRAYRVGFLSRDKRLLSLSRLRNCPYRNSGDFASPAPEPPHSAVTQMRSSVTCGELPASPQ